jgi:hypothetical protein
MPQSQSDDLEKEKISWPVRIKTVDHLAYSIVTILSRLPQFYM